jgi:hypothetical protein
MVFNSAIFQRQDTATTWVLPSAIRFTRFGTHAARQRTTLLVRYEHSRCDFVTLDALVRMGSPIVFAVAWVDRYLPPMLEPQKQAFIRFI